MDSFPTTVMGYNFVRIHSTLLSGHDRDGTRNNPKDSRGCSHREAARKVYPGTGQQRTENRLGWDVPPQTPDLQPRCVYRTLRSAPTRAVEALVKPEITRTRKQSAHRVSQTATLADEETRATLLQIFNLRSYVEHMHPVLDSLEGDETVRISRRATLRETWQEAMRSHRRSS